MTSDGLRPIEPLVPLIDQMRVLARSELPSRRTGKIRLWDDGTFDVRFYHSRGDSLQVVHYVRTTGEIIYAHARGGHVTETEFTPGETLHEPHVDDIEARVLATVNPPYRIRGDHRLEGSESASLVTDTDVCGNYS